MNPKNHLASLERQEIQGVGLNLADLWLPFGIKRGNFW